MKGNKTMYARATNVQVSPDKVDEAIQLFRDSVVPAAKQQRGWKGVSLFVERKTGKLQSIGLWETEADAQATGEGSAYLQEQFAKFANLFTAPPVVTHYEVVVDE
jgi:heme-degrading monooxygenase HmoA